MTGTSRDPEPYVPMTPEQAALRAHIAARMRDGADPADIADELWSRSPRRSTQPPVPQHETEAGS